MSVAEKLQFQQTLPSEPGDRETSHVVHVLQTVAHVHSVAQAVKILPENRKIVGSNPQRGSEITSIGKVKFRRKEGRKEGRKGGLRERGHNLKIKFLNKYFEQYT